MNATTSAMAWLMLLAIVVLIAGHGLRLFARGRWLALDPLNAFWGGVVVVYVLQPLEHAELYSSWHESGVLEKTLFWILVGLICVVAGYESRLGVRAAYKLPRMPARLDTGRLGAAAVVMIAIGLAGYAYLVASAGGATEWLSVGRGGTNWANVSGYLAQMEGLLPAGVATAIFRAESHRLDRKSRLLAWLLGAIHLWWFLYLGTRSRTIMFTVFLLAAYYLPRRRNPPAWLLGCVFVGLLVVVNFQAMYRDRFTNLSVFGQVDVEEALGRSLPTWLGGTRQSESIGVWPNAEFNCVMTVVELVPERIDYNYGYSHLEFFTRVVPRAIWPDKIYPHAQAYTPIMRQGGLSESVIGTAKEELLMGPSFTFVGHWYSVGGPIALVAAGLLTGALLRMIRTILDREPWNEGDKLLYIGLITLGFGEAAGEPLFWVFSLPFTLAPLLILIRLSRTRGRSQAKVEAGHVPATAKPGR